MACEDTATQLVLTEHAVFAIVLKNDGPFSAPRFALAYHNDYLQFVLKGKD